MENLDYFTFNFNIFLHCICILNIINLDTVYQTVSPRPRLNVFYRHGFTASATQNLISFKCNYTKNVLFFKLKI